MIAVEPLSDDEIAGAVRNWVETFVIDMNLCPFARPELAKERVRFTVTGAITEAQLLAALQTELELLANHPLVETTLLIHARLLQNFPDYNQFLDLAEHLLRQMNLEGVYQIASFHPDYQFDGTDAEDAENYTNRSPYPLLHIIREASLERAIASFAHVDQIPLRNIAHMNKLGQPRLAGLMQACFTATGNTKP